MPDMIIRPIPPEVRHLVARTRRNDTPDNILRNSLKEAFDVDPDDNARYRRFISSLMTNLSLLVSNDKSSEMFD